MGFGWIVVEWVNNIEICKIISFCFRSFFRFPYIGVNIFKKNVGGEIFVQHVNQFFLGTATYERRIEENKFGFIVWFWLHNHAMLCLLVTLVLLISIWPPNILLSFYNQSRNVLTKRQSTWWAAWVFDYSKSFQNVPNYFRTYQNILKYFNYSRAFQIILFILDDHFKTF